MALSLEKIVALAPDQESVHAARKLLKAAGWPRLAADDMGLVWGECQGSGATPYRVVISETDAGYKCTCPSRKFPCKHALALMWLRAEGKVAFQGSDAPEWVKDWVARRRGPGVAVSPAESNSADSITWVVLLAAAGAPEQPPDPKAQARAAASRERNRAEREGAIRDGLAALDLWLQDQVDRGMAGFVAQSSAACRSIAKRLVDAKAPGLAGRLDALSSRLFSLPEAARPIAAVEELGQLHLMAEAYRRQDDLSPALRADVRQAIGWPVSREDLLSDGAAERVEGQWRVVAVLSEVQPDKLRRIETWLRREGSGRFALLLDFVPVATGAAAGGYIVGERLEAELVFYPSAAPLRALVARSSGSQPSGAALDLPDAGLAEAYASYEAALAALPWVGTWPLSFRFGRVRRAGKALYLCDARGSTVALSLPATQSDLAEALLAFESLDAVALWDGRFCTLCWAETSLGRWTCA
jgi:hypothetical protein